MYWVQMRCIYRPVTILLVISRNVRRTRFKSRLNTFSKWILNRGTMEFHSCKIINSMINLIQENINLILIAFAQLLYIENNCAQANWKYFGIFVIVSNIITNSYENKFLKLHGIYMHTHDSILWYAALNQFGALFFPTKAHSCNLRMRLVPICLCSEHILVYLYFANESITSEQRNWSLKIWNYFCIIKTRKTTQIHAVAIL